MVSGGLSFDKIQRMINEAKKEGDVFANMIYKLELLNNKVTVLLDNTEIDTDDLLPVDIDISQNAFMNAQIYYSAKKKQASKEVKTLEAAKHAIVTAEKNAVSEIKKVYIFFYLEQSKN